MAEHDPAQAESVLAVDVFGVLRVWWNSESGRVDVTAHLQPRGLELLAHLALHPDGVTRQTLIEDLWRERRSCRPVKALQMTINRLNRAVRAATHGALGQVTAADRHRYRLAPTISSDYQRFTQAVREHSSGTQHHDACQRVIECARPGVLAKDLTAQWVTPIREAACRDVIAAAGVLASAIGEGDPRGALNAVETAVQHNRFNEQLWRDIIRLHARLGEYSVVEQTLNLLTHTLTDIGEKPSRTTRELVEKIRQQIQ